MDRVKEIVSLEKVLYTCVQLHSRVQLSIIIIIQAGMYRLIIKRP